MLTKDDEKHAKTLRYRGQRCVSDAVAMKQLAERSFPEHQIHRVQELNVLEVISHDVVKLESLKFFTSDKLISDSN